MYLLLATLSQPAVAAKYAPREPTVADALRQETLMGLAPGEAVKVNKVVRAIEQTPWAASVTATDDSIVVRLVHGDIATATLELDTDSGGRQTARAVDLAFRGPPLWAEVLPGHEPTRPLGLDEEGRTLWTVAPGVAAVAETDGEGVMRLKRLDAGHIDISQTAASMRATFTGQLLVGELDGALATLRMMSVFGQQNVRTYEARWRDRRALLCAAPLVEEAARAASATGGEQRRAVRRALAHTLSDCRDRSGRLLDVAVPPLTRLVATTGALAGAEGQAAWRDLSRGQLPGAQALEDLSQALRMHRGGGVSSVTGKVWAQADWPQRIALLGQLEISLLRATSAESDALTAARDVAREELRLQLVAERDRARTDSRWATAEVAQAALYALADQPPPDVRSLLDDSPLAIWLRGTLVAVRDRPDNIALVDAALANHRLDSIGMTIPVTETLLAHPDVTWGDLDVGVFRKAVKGPTAARESVMHTWLASKAVPSPESQAAEAERIRLAEALREVRVPPSPLVNAPLLVTSPGAQEDENALADWRRGRVAWIEARLRELDQVPEQTTARELVDVTFQAEVQRWEGTVTRRLRLELPTGNLTHEPAVDVGQWRYLRHAENPRIQLPAVDQLTDLKSVEGRARRELQAGEAADITALLAQGVGKQAWYLAQQVRGSAVDRAREAAALQWLMTGQEAPDIAGIGAIDDLRGQRLGIPGRALVAKASSDGERIVVLRSPFSFEVFTTDDVRRIAGPFDVEGRVSELRVDAAVRMSNDGTAVRVANTAVDLGSGRVLSKMARDAHRWGNPDPLDIEVVATTTRDDKPAVAAQHTLDPRSARVAPLPRLDDRDWTLTGGMASPDLRRVLVSLQDRSGDRAIALIDTPDGNVLESWNIGAPTMAGIADGFAVADGAGITTWRWTSTSAERDQQGARPVPPGLTDRAGLLLADRAGIVEVLDGYAIAYGTEGTMPVMFDLTTSLAPQLLDKGRLLMTHDGRRMHLTPVPLGEAPAAEALRTMVEASVDNGRSQR